MSHRYELRLSLAEVDTIRYVADHGYAMEVWNAITSDLTEAIEPPEAVEGTEANTLFLIPESLAWNVKEEEETNGGHGFGPVSDSLTAKLHAFLHAIV